jgi:UDP-GlcNAc:undecaprenyl-phosphate GlcNAc-1-phosphate transferase
LHYSFSLIIAFGLTAFLIVALRPVAMHIDLVDRPGERKTHGGEVPLTGGIAMFIGLLLAILTLDSSLSWLRAFFIGSVILILTGVLDDLHELSTTARFVAQIIATSIMAVMGGVVLNDFGYLLSTGFILETGWLAVPVTVFAAIGVINALNMLDGIDGLAGFITLVSIIGMGIVSAMSGDTNTLLILGLFAAVVVAFLAFNLNCDDDGCSRVFMGDAGSMFLGFVLSWFFISLAQGDERAMAPVTALWLFAVPLIETLTMMIRRVRKGRSPFSADMEHLHHMLELSGYSRRKTLLFIVSAALVFMVIGLAGHFMQVAEPLMFYSFLLAFGVYLFFVKYKWSVLRMKD